LPDFDLDAFFDEFSRVWNEHDLDGIAAQFTEDGVYEASSGPDASGKRGVGHEAIRRLAAELFNQVPDLAFQDRFFHYSDGVAVVEGTQTGTWPDGTAFSTGCVDILIFKDGKLAAKRAYRKDHSRGN